MKQRQLKLAAQHAARQVSSGVFISEFNFCFFLHECVLKQICIKHCILNTFQSSVKTINIQTLWVGLEPQTFALLEQMSNHWASNRIYFWYNSL